jgi:hypothetical protein
MPISNNLGTLNSNEPSTHHGPEFGQECFNSIGRIHNLHDHGQIERKSQDIRVVEVLRPAKAHRPSQYRSTGELQFPRPKYDGLVERTMLIFIGLSYEDPEQQAFTRQFPRWGGRGLPGGRRDLGGCDHGGDTFPEGAAINLSKKLIRSNLLSLRSSSFARWNCSLRQSQSLDTHKK